MGQRKGRIVVEFGSADDLERIAGLMGAALVRDTAGHSEVVPTARAAAHRARRAVPREPCLARAMPPTLQGLGVARP